MSGVLASDATRSIACPTCGAPPGTACHLSIGDGWSGNAEAFHAERFRLAAVRAAAIEARAIADNVNHEPWARAVRKLCDALDRLCGVSK